MDADPAVSADLVPVALFAPRSRPQPARPRRTTRAGPPLGGPVRSTPERTGVLPGGRTVRAITTGPGPEPQ
jgi:hypothetical protein